jgi:hypothetical protein
LGVNYNPSTIASSSLVLSLDAANIRSYPGSGTTWSDLSVNKNNVTLVNGVGYTANDRGALTFDGTNDYADFFAPNLGDVATIEAWIKVGTPYVNRMICGWSQYDVYFTLSGVFGYNTANNGDLYGISAATVTSLGLIGNWKHYVFEMRVDGPYTNNKIYVNTALQALSQQAGTENVSNRVFNSGQGRISGWRLNTSYPIRMDCAIFKVYNRSLSLQEIQNNFSATRGRFGV